MTTVPRRQVLITGAAGGIGRACARLFGAIDSLVLTDINSVALETFSEELRRDGYDVVARSGDLSDDALLEELVGAIADGGRPLGVVHTAGLAPSQADWRTIMQVNLVGTEKLLKAIEPVLASGSVAILISSVGARMISPTPEAEAVLAQPLQPNFLDAVERLITSSGGGKAPGGMGGFSYSLSKRAVLALVQKRAICWGPKGSRINSISPGLIQTPMAQSEMEKYPYVAQLLKDTPMGRIGTPMDIAMAAHFLASDAASFISGADLLVDGAVTAALTMSA